MAKAVIEIMNALRFFAVIPLLVLVSSGSEEEFLPLNKLVFVSDEVSEAGKVTVEISARKGEITSLSLEAFGRKEVLKPEDMRLLSGFPLHTLVFIHEAGYEITGGYSVGLRLTRYFRDAEEKPGKETAYVSLSRNAPIRVNKYPG